MYEDTNNQCTSKLNTAIGYLNGLSSSERTTFQTSTDYVVSTARTRLEAWARNQGKTINYSTGELEANRNVLSLITENNKNIILIVVISLVSLSSFGLSMYIKKKKSFED